MDENPYRAPQTSCSPARRFAKLLPLVLPVLLALMAYSAFKIFLETPSSVIGR